MYCVLEVGRVLYCIEFGVIARMGLLSWWSDCDTPSW